MTYRKRSNEVPEGSTIAENEILLFLNQIIKRNFNLSLEKKGKKGKATH